MNFCLLCLIVLVQLYNVHYIKNMDKPPNSHILFSFLQFEQNIALLNIEMLKHIKSITTMIQF